MLIIGKMELNSSRSSIEVITGGRAAQISAGSCSSQRITSRAAASHRATLKDGEGGREAYSEQQEAVVSPGTDLCSWHSHISWWLAGPGADAAWVPVGQLSPAPSRCLSSARCLEDTPRSCTLATSRGCSLQRLVENLAVFGACLNETRQCRGQKPASMLE